MDDQPLTYQQILAQQYEENARDLLVYSTQYDEVEGHNVEEHSVTNNIGQELTDPHEFQRFGGARNTDQVILKTKEFDDKGNTSVRRAKDVKRHIFNVDTIFRAFAVGGILPTPPSLIGNANSFKRLPIVSNSTSTTSHFIFNLDSQYKNIISAKLSTFQLPNTFFNLVDSRNNYYVYTKKGNFTDTFTLPVTKIGRNSRSTQTIIELGVNISPLVADDIITITSGIYAGSHRVVESSVSTISIDFIDQPISSTATTITFAPNSKNTLAGFTRVSVYITSVNKDPRFTLTPVLTEVEEGQTGFYYNNHSIFPALNNAYASVFPDLKFSYEDGFTNIINNSSTDTYTINLTPETTGIYPAYFPTLGEMLGFYNYIYEINTANLNTLAPCSSGCGQISACSTFGSLFSENKIDMNADSYIQLAVQSWENVYQQDGADSYYGVFQKIPINSKKGDIIYDIAYNNSTSRKYDFIQPTNVRYLEIYLYDRLGYPLLMPGVEWSMTLELEEVLNSGLYDKLREL